MISINTPTKTDELRQLFVDWAQPARKAATAGDGVALFFSGGIDSVTVLCSLLDGGVRPKLYSIHLEGVWGDDYKSCEEIAVQLQLEHFTVEIPKSTDLRPLYGELVSAYSISRRTASSLLCVSLFWLATQQVAEELVYSGLGNGWCGIGRNFRIKCSLAGEKIPSAASLAAHRTAKWKHLREQYDVLQVLTGGIGKRHIAPFIEKDVYDFFCGLTYDDCNKPKLKQVLVDCWPKFYETFPPRYPMNLQCGNSGFKALVPSAGWWKEKKKRKEE